MGGHDIGADRAAGQRLLGRLPHLPARPLFSRSYDAEGFYDQLQQTGTDIWSTLIPILKAGSNTAAFAAAGGNGEPLLDAWAAGYFRDPSRGAAWDIVGPGIPRDKPGPTRLNAPVDASVDGGGCAATATPSTRCSRRR